MTKTVRIGGAAAFLGDFSIATPQLLEAGNIQYLIYDYLSEAGMSILARAMRKNPQFGYARMFAEKVWKPHCKEIMKSGTKLVTNAGGLNPHACAAGIRAIAAEANLEVRIAVVTGDNLLDMENFFQRNRLQEMGTGAALPPLDSIISANAYFGATSIAAGLKAGADIVITGRVVDSALVLGPLVHEFGWSWNDFDRLAQGSLAGHILECGAQATGGLFTDWRDVPDWANIGYPIAEFSESGDFTVTKPAGTGGICTTASISEQIVYETGDPQAYLLPDVSCDFSEVRCEQIGSDVVRVTGAKGRPPSGNYKACITYEDGFTAVAVTPVIGFEAAAKARRQAEAVLERCQVLLKAKGLPPFESYRIESLGSEASYGPHGRASATREVVCRLAAHHKYPEALNLLLEESVSSMTSMSVGTTHWYSGLSRVVPAVKVFSALVPKRLVRPSLSVDEKAVEISSDIVDHSDGSASRPKAHTPDALDGSEPEITVRLMEIAHGRSGDKGNSFNVGILARRPEYLPYIRRALTAEYVAGFFQHDSDNGETPKVQRFDWPGLDGINFLCHGVLGGGQMFSLAVDPLGKAKAQQLLDSEIQIPKRVLSVNAF